MDKLRKQIRESFFNPVLYFLPLLIFLVVHEFFGLNLAWKISFPVAFALLIYIYFACNRTFVWHIIFITFYVCVGLISGMEYLFPLPVFVGLFVTEIVTFILLLAFILFRKQIQRKILGMMPKYIPMSNNFNELYRAVWALFLVLFFYITVNLILHFFGLDNSNEVQMLKYFYLGLIVFLVTNELLRVQIIQAKLINEEWWPIINKQGKIIGSIEHLTSLNDEKKYMHPVVRVLLIDKAMVLLQKRSLESVVYPGLWDTAITNHVKIGESIDQCVNRTAINRYSLVDFKYMYLANYSIEVEKEFHYAFLFVSSPKTELSVKSVYTDQLKWWTQQQIEANFETGIFTDNFKMEYDLLKRSGLLETGTCDCECKLKDTIYKQSKTKKE